MADTVLDGLNRYSYVRNNLLRYTDPTGKCRTDSAEAVACYAAYARSAGVGSAHDQMTAGLWEAWGRASVAATRYVESFAERTDTAGYELFYASADPGHTSKQIQSLAEGAFIRTIAADFAGLTLGNGILLLPEGIAEGPSRIRPPKEIVGTSGWVPGLVDDGSPARHMVGWLAIGYEYGTSQTEAALRFAEGDTSLDSNSLGDYELGVIGYRAGVELHSLGTSGPDLIAQIVALTSSPSQAEFVPQRRSPAEVPGASPWCYLGFSC